MANSGQAGAPPGEGLAWVFLTASVVLAIPVIGFLELFGVPIVVILWLLGVRFTRASADLPAWRGEAPRQQPERKGMRDGLVAMCIVTGLVVWAVVFIALAVLAPMDRGGGLDPFG